MLGVESKKAEVYFMYIEVYLIEDNNADGCFYGFIADLCSLRLEYSRRLRLLLAR
jgi:hypothetical protein